MSDISALRELVPQNKIDMARAEAIVALGYPVVAPILPELIEWLQDCNWPVATVLSPFLSGIGLPLLPHIRHVLSTDDEIWKYWVLSRLVGPSPPLIAALRAELEQLAERPTVNQVAEELDVMAREILDSLKAA